MGYMFRTGLALAMCVAGPALADWQGRASDDGAYFYGIASSVQAGVSLRCIGPSAGGRAPLEVEAHEVAPTANFGIRFEMDPRLLPAPDRQGRRSDVLAWTDQGGVRLPVVLFNELNGIWDFELPMTDPFVYTLFSTKRLVLGPEAGPHYDLPVEGLPAALTVAFRHCVDNYARMGLAVPRDLAAFGSGAAQQSDDAGLEAPSPMDVAAHQHIQRSCNGGANREQGYILRGEIDGDGVIDTVLDWSRISCHAGGRFFCGASQCSADVFLSGSFPRKGQPEALIASGVSLQPLDNGRQAVVLGGSLSSCSQIGLTACEGLWYWTGRSLELLQSRAIAR